MNTDPIEDRESLRMLATALFCLLGWVGAVLIAMLLGGCAPKPVVLTPIAPAAARLKAATTATTAAAKGLHATVGTIATQAGALSATLAQGMLDADRVRKSGLADQTFLNLNADRWQAAAVKIGLLEAMTHSAAINSSGLVDSIVSIDADSGALVVAATATDAGIVTLQTELVAKADDAAVGALLKRSVWIAFVCIVIALLLYLFVKFSPAIIQAFKPL